MFISYCFIPSKIILLKDLTLIILVSLSRRKPMECYHMLYVEKQMNYMTRDFFIQSMSFDGNFPEAKLRYLKIGYT
jgi:hypothetical protein